MPVFNILFPPQSASESGCLAGILIHLILLPADILIFAPADKLCQKDHSQPYKYPFISHIQHGNASGDSSGDKACNRPGIKPGPVQHGLLPVQDILSPAEARTVSDCWL